MAQAWAEVRARGESVRYRRSGSGPTVVIVGPGDAGGLWETLELALVASCRVLAPHWGALTAANVGARMDAFLEGLGIHDVTVILTDPALVEPLRALQARIPETVTRVLLVATVAGAD